MTRLPLLAVLLAGCATIDISKIPHDTSGTSSAPTGVGSTPSGLPATGTTGTTDPDADGDGYPASTDCDDANRNVHPGAVEVCNGVDDDCDGHRDDTDLDGDGEIDAACGGPDCDDSDALVCSTCAETVDGQDNDCNGLTDDGIPDFDADGDCFCTTGPCTGSSAITCTAPQTGDCDDTDERVHPGQQAFFDTPTARGSFDYDCSGTPEQQWATTGGCFGAVWICYPDPTGWSGSVPTCGVDGSYVIACPATFVCDAVTTEQRTQACH